MMKQTKWIYAPILVLTLVGCNDPQPIAETPAPTPIATIAPTPTPAIELSKESQQDLTPILEKMDDFQPGTAGQSLKAASIYASILNGGNGFLEEKEAVIRYIRKNCKKILKDHSAYESLVEQLKDLNQQYETNPDLVEGLMSDAGAHIAKSTLSKEEMRSIMETLSEVEK